MAGGPGSVALLPASEISYVQYILDLILTLHCVLVVTFAAVALEMAARRNLATLYHYYSLSLYLSLVIRNIDYTRTTHTNERTNPYTFPSAI